MSFQVEIDKKIKDGSIYFVGDALPSDWYAAFQMWSGLAKTGEMKAQLNTGWCYLYGEGIEVSRQESMSWLIKAAAQNCPKAHWYLSRDYFGLDDASRTAHFERAIALGDKLASQYSKELRTREEEESKKKVDEEDAARVKLIYQDLIKDFAAENYAQAKDRLNQAVTRHPYIFANLRAAFDISPTNISVDKRSKKGALVSGGMVNGTTQHYQEWIQSLDISFTLKNSSTVPVEVLLRSLRDDSHGGKADYFFHDLGTISPGESKTVSRTIFPEVRSILQPYLFVSSSGHSFEVPLTGLKMTVFPSCKSKLKNAGCFVLTACYGDTNHPTVVNFRDFRDTHLAKYSIGRALIALYYVCGPKAAAFVQDKPLIKAMLRALFSALRQVLPR